jgi:hypothetical protein
VPCDVVKTRSDLLRNSPRKCSRHAGAARLQPICIVCACEEIHCGCIAVSKCNIGLLYRNTLYIGNMIGRKTKVPVTTTCPLRSYTCVLRCHREFSEGKRCLGPMSLPLRLLQTDLSFSRVKMKHRRAVSFASRPADFSSGRDWTDRIASGVLPPRPNWGPYTASSGLPLRSYLDRRNAPGVRLLRPNRGPYAASSGLHLRSYRDQRNAPGVRLLRPNRGPYAAPSGLHLQSYRDRRNAPDVRLLRPNRGPYAASSGLHLRSYRDRRNAPGMRLLRPNRGPYAALSGLHLRSRR